MKRWQHISTGILAANLFAAPASASERMASAADSGTAFAMLIVAVLVGAGLAAGTHGMRKAALWGAALTLLGGAAALGSQVGKSTYFKAPLTPLDPLKPAILNGFIGLAAIAGLFLAYAAAQPVNAAPPPVQYYDRTSRFLHWTTALIFVALVPLGLFMAGLPEGSTIRDPLYIVHKSLGLTVLLLVIVRLIWHRLHRVPPLSVGLSRANRIGVKTAHVLLYVLMIGFPVSGYLLSTLFGKIAPLYWIDLPIIFTPDKQLALPFGGLHKILLPLVFYLVFAAHVAGVIKHHFIDKHRDAIRRMIG